MKRTNVGLVAALSVLACLVGLASAAETDDSQLQTVEFIGLTAELPAAWIEQPPSSSMRIAQYVIAGENEDESAQFVVFYFGPGQGGTVNDNIARWQSQFSSPDGSPVTPAVESLVVGGMPATVAEFTGNYARAVGMGQGGTGLPDQMLIAAIMETHHGNLNIQLYGPAGFVSAHREAYLSFIKSLRSQSEI